MAKLNNLKRPIIVLFTKSATIAVSSSPDGRNPVDTIKTVVVSVSTNAEMHY